MGTKTLRIDQLNFGFSSNLVFTNDVLDLAADVTIANDLTITGSVLSDTIIEKTLNAGVTVDGILIKDGLVGGITPTYGSAVNTVCQGNDSRLSNARTPTGSAGGSLSGSYPNPNVYRLHNGSKLFGQIEEGTVDGFKMYDQWGFGDINVTNTNNYGSLVGSRNSLVGKLATFISTKTAESSPLVEFLTTSSVTSTTLLFSNAGDGKTIQIDSTGSATSHILINESASPVFEIASSGYVKIGGDKVLGDRGAAVAKPAGGVTVDAESRTAIDALIDRFRVTGGHGAFAD